jgi:hypothetical protein
LGHEGNAADPFHALGLGRWAHPGLRQTVRQRWQTFDLSNHQAPSVNATECADCCNMCD